MSKYFNRAWLPVVVGALGYFVDIYDAVLFGIVRVESLTAIGVPPDRLMGVGVLLLNTQMIGMLLGGLGWGMLGDKRGRISVLFGSIVLYSVATFANAFVTTVEMYALLRFIAGVGLAGELGAAVTLVSESLPKESRGHGTAIVAAVGVLGAVAAGLTGDLLGWRTTYMIGGIMGVALLALRIGILESGMYEHAKKQDVRRGDLRMLFWPPRRFLRFLSCVGIAIPIWYVVSVILTFAPEFARVLPIEGRVTAAYAILWGYAGLSAGDLLSGLLSQYFRSRKKVVLGFLLALLVLVVATLNSSGISADMFYAYCFLLGCAGGYWALFITLSAEQVGTNIRSLVATSAPNFVRGSVALVTLAFNFGTPRLGLVGSALAVGGTCIAIALISLRALEETFGKDLNYVER